MDECIHGLGPVSACTICRVEEVLQEVRARRSLPPPAMRKAIREAAGLSLGKVGSALGVHEATVMRWERGSHEPTAVHLVAYAELLEALRGAS